MFAVLLVSRSGIALTGAPADEAFLDAFGRNALAGVHICDEAAANCRGLLWRTSSLA
jgi:hypothetical protein